MCSFGSGSSGPSAPTTQFTTQTTTADPRAQAMYSQAWQQAQKVANRPFQPYSYDPSAFVAPLNPVQLQAVGNIAGYQGTADPYYQAAGGMAGAAGMTTTPEVVGQYMSPYMSQVVDPIKAAMQQQFGQQLSQQQAQAIKAGAFGGERAGLQRAQLMGQQALGLGQALSPLYQTGYGQALQGAQTDLARQLQASQVLGGLGTGAQTAGLQGAQALLGAGTLGQQTQQAGLQALYNQYMLQQQYPFMAAQYLSQTAGALGPGYGGTTTGTQQSMQPLSYWGNPLSDPDLKTGPRGDDKPEVIGETNDGQKIYRYRLIDPDTGELGPPQIGLMADEVEERTPEAVGDYKGYRTVDYAKATDDAARMGGGVRSSGDYADGGSVLDDILESQGKMYEPLSKSTEKGIVPSATITPARLESPSLSYSKPQQQQQSSLADSLGSALNLYKGGKEALSLGKEAAGGLGLSGLLSGLGSAAGTVGATGGVPVSVLGGLGPMGVQTFGAAAAPAAAGGLAGLGSAIMSALPFLATLVSDPALKTGVRPKAADGMGVREGSPDYSPDEAEPDPFEEAVSRTFKFEGGLNPNDAGKGPSMYGINQAAHPGLDVRKITPSQAKDIYRKEYWEGIGADKLPSDVREMAYDTAVMAGPRRAKQLLEIAGTDPSSFMAAREKFLSNLVASDPGKYGQYAKSWSNRNEELRRLAGLGDASSVLENLPPSARKWSASMKDASPDEAPSGLSGFLRGTRPEGVGEKAADFLTSERFIVPLLAGLGTMASSGSRFLAPSILQGVGGGAKAYAELAQQQFEREKAAQQLGLEARKTAVAEAGIPLTERELKIKEQEAARKMRALQELAKTAGKVYDTSAPSAPASGAPIDVQPEFPVTPSGTPTPMPEPRPKDLGQQPASASASLAPKEDFWADVDPMMNPSKLLGMAQEAERKASVAAQDFPEWSKMLNDQALKFRSAASDILKGGSVLKGGQMVPIPGALESKKKEQQQAEEVKSGLELVEVQPKPGGPVLKVARKDLGAMAGAAPGAGTPPGAIISKQPASVEAQIDEVRKDENAMVDQYRQRQIAKERMDALIDSLRVLETGKFAERKAEAVAALRSLGFEVPSTATANPEEFQKFIKNSTANIFDQVKAMGGKILVSEITGLTKANANPELQPGANAALIGQAKGLLDYEDQHYKDYRAWRRANPDKYSPSDLGDFETEWVEKNPLGRYAREAEMRVGARGAPLLPAEKREKGYTYTNDQGVTGRWNGTSWDIIGGPKQ